MSRGSDSFTWDHENRLTAATISSTTWSHEYNGDGLRMSRSDGTTTVDYVWDIAGGLPMLLQDGTNTYVYGLGLIAIYDGSEMTYRLVDGLGSTVNLCDEDGELIGEYAYDAYGNVRSQDGAETEFSFAGEQSDPNGLDFLRARYYDPEIGRFLGLDPLGGGYGYAAGDPINMADPSGLAPVYAGVDEVCYTSACDRVWYRPVWIDVPDEIARKVTIVRTEVEGYGCSVAGENLCALQDATCVSMYFSICSTTLLDDVAVAVTTLGKEAGPSDLLFKIRIAAIFLDGEAIGLHVGGRTYAGWKYETFKDIGANYVSAVIELQSSWFWQTHVTINFSYTYGGTPSTQVAVSGTAGLNPGHNFFSLQLPLGNGTVSGGP